MRALAFTAVAFALSMATIASASDVTRFGKPGGLVHESVQVGSAAKYLFIGGHAAALLDPNDRSKGYGDTKAQTISTLTKLKKVLESHGYAMGDMVKMNIFVTADPALGSADYAGMNAGFKEFFGSADNPNTVVRTALEVKALQLPGLYIEIEGMAAR